MTDGVVAKWYVKEGDEVAPGDVLADIETDKATMEMESVDAGRIGSILVPAGAASVAVHTPIAILLEEGEAGLEATTTGPQEVRPAQHTGNTTDTTKANSVPETPSRNASSSQKASGARSQPSRAYEKHSSALGRETVRTLQTGERIFASPLARRLALDKGIDLHQIQGSGPYGRIVRRDVETAQPVKPFPVVADGMDPRALYSSDSYDEVPLDNMRRIIARRLTQSMQQAPHYYLRVDCRIDLLLQVRKRLNERQVSNNLGIRLSVNDFLLRAAALTLMEIPEVNSSWAEECLLRHHHADISIAVALDGGGLVTPILRNVEGKGLAKIAAESRILIDRARERKLDPADYEGGSFTISNLGMFGIDAFTAVINPPQSAILAVGMARKKPMVSEDSSKIAVADVMSLTLSCDHRVIDGALGARFLKGLQQRIEDPFSMLL